MYFCCGTTLPERIYMNELFFVFANSITSLVLCMAVGFFCFRKKILTDTHVSGLTDLIIKVSLPATIFTSLMRPFSRELLFDLLMAIVFFAALTLLAGTLGGGLAKLMKATKDETEAWQFGSAFGNIAFMGIPIVNAVFGPEGVIFVAMSMIASNLLSFTYGLRIFNAKPKIDVLSICKNTPALPTVLVGFVMFLTGIRLPSPVENGIGFLSGITTPISMIVIGAVLAKENLREALLDLRILPHSFLRLVFFPIATLLILRAVFGDTLMVNVLVALKAMPVAAMTVILAEKHAKHPGISARFVVVTTLLSIVTVPLISLLL